MSKQSIIMAVVVVLFVALISGYIIYQNITGESVEEELKGETSLLLEDIENITGLGFSNEQEMEFSWMVEQDGEIKEFSVNGRQVEAKRVLDVDSIKIEDYFKNNEFELDVYNDATGTVIGLSGYKKGNNVCIVVAEVCTEETSCFDKSDITIKCGYLDESSEPISFGDISEQELTVKEGENFSIFLDANLTTGYQWQMDLDRVFIQFLDVSYTPPSTELVGASGVEKFDFKAVSKGMVNIIFSYLRPWEEKAPIKKIIYNLIIE